MKHGELLNSGIRALAGTLALLIALAGVPRASDGAGIGIPHDLSADHPAGSTYMGVTLLGTLDLDSVSVGQGHRLHSLSALGFDEDADLLYALSDRGVLFHLRLEFEGDLLVQAHAVDAHPLLDARGRPLRGYRADAEGMVLRNARNGVSGDTEVLISFERRPRVIRFDVRGAPTGAIALPPRLRDGGAYRSGNKGLEALALHPRFGVLVGAEHPMLDSPQDQVQIHAIEQDITWSYPVPTEPNHGLAALEALPDGRLLTLERAHGFLFVPFITIIREFRPLPAHPAQLGEGRVVARLSTGHGFMLDNFEGLTRHRGQRFLIVSDDNAKPFQASLLSYFETMDVGGEIQPVQEQGQQTER